MREQGNGSNGSLLVAGLKRVKMKNMASGGLRWPRRRKSVDVVLNGR